MMQHGFQKLPIMIRRMSLLGCAAAIILGSALLQGGASRTPPGAAGTAPGRSCATAACHGNASKPGGVVDALFINGGYSYVPGVTQHIVITIIDPGQQRWGFQATARIAARPEVQAGRFDPSDYFTQVICEDGNTRPDGQTCAQPFEYITHTLAGTQPGTPSPARFEIDWDPPTTGAGDVLFYVSAIAADGDGTARGDRFYSQTYTLRQLSTVRPSIAPNGVVNAASYAPEIAPGSWFTINGVNLAITTRGLRASDLTDGRLPNTMDNIYVWMNNKPAFLSFISPRQVNGLAPDDVGPGPVTVQLNAPGGGIEPFVVTMRPISPALFVRQGKYAVAQHADYTLAESVSPGETIIVYGNGFGRTTPSNPAGQVARESAHLTLPSVAKIGGLPAEISYAGLSTGAAGLYQFNLRVPESAPDGDLPIVVEYGGAQTQPGVMLRVQR
jgi:uncharacterized protein (TIGR03437 family)